MDLLENVATELGFQFHLYLVRDELYGAKYSALTNGQSSNLQSSEGGGGGEGVDASEDSTTTGGQMAQRQSNSYGDVEIESDWDQANGSYIIQKNTTYPCILAPYLSPSLDICLGSFNNNDNIHPHSP